MFNKKNEKKNQFVGKGFFVLIFMLLALQAYSIQLKLNLKKGDSFLYSLEKKQSMVSGDKNTGFRTGAEARVSFLVRVINVNGETVKLSFLLKKAELTLVSPSGIAEFTTESKKYPENPFLALFIEMKKTPIIYTFGVKTFNLIKIEGFDRLNKQVFEHLSLKNPDLKKRLKKIIKENSKKIRQGYMFNVELLPYLNRELKQGKSFKVKQNLKMGNVDIEVNINYTVEKITDKFVFFKLFANINSPEKETVFGGMKAIAKIKGKQEGSLTVFRDCGLVNFYSSKQEINGLFTIKETGESIPVNIESITIIRFKRVK